MEHSSSDLDLNYAMNRACKICLNEAQGEMMFFIEASLEDFEKKYRNGYGYVLLESILNKKFFDIAVDLDKKLKSLEEKGGLGAHTRQEILGSFQEFCKELGEEEKIKYDSRRSNNLTKCLEKYEAVFKTLGNNRCRNKRNAVIADVTAEICGWFNNDEDKAQWNKTLSNIIDQVIEEDNISPTNVSNVRQNKKRKHCDDNEPFSEVNYCDAVKPTDVTETIPSTHDDKIKRKRALTNKEKKQSKKEETLQAQRRAAEYIQNVIKKKGGETTSNEYTAAREERSKPKATSIQTPFTTSTNVLKETKVVKSTLKNKPGKKKTTREDTTTAKQRAANYIAEMFK